MKRILHFEKLLFYSLIIFLPTQLGKHFWPNFSSVIGIRVDYLSPTIFFTDALVAFLFVFWLLRILRVKHEIRSKIKDQRSKMQVKIKKHHLLSIFAFCFLLFNILLSNRIEGGLYSFLKFLEMAFVAYYTAKFIDLKNNLPKIITLLSIGAIAESAIAIFQYLLQGSIGGMLYYLGERTFNASTPGIANASLGGELVLRSYGTFPHPNVLAGFLVVVMALILYSLRFRKYRKEARSKSQELWYVRQIISPLIRNSYFLIQSIAIALGTVALFLSMSRIAIVLWVLVLGWYVAKALTRHPGKRSASRISSLRDSGQARLAAKLARMSIAIALIIFAGIGSIFVFTPIGSRFTNIKIGDEAIVQREVLISSSLKMIERSPLFGVGLGNFIPTIATIQKPLSLGLYLQPVHNIFLLVTAETGLVGLGFFTWFLWKTYQGIMKQESRIKEMLVMALTSILILGLFDHYWLTLQQGQLLFAIIIGLCYNPSQYGRTTG